MRAVRGGVRRLWDGPAVWVVLILAAGGGLLWVGHAVDGAIEGHRTPSCSWALRVRGASAAQAGLARCYVRDLASRDSGGLAAMSADSPHIRITGADLARSADARSGPASAVCTPNPSDPTDVNVTITFADGATESTGMMNMIAMGGPSVWRMNIGTDTQQGGPAPARKS
jgi:hypothetical protein